MMSLLDLSKHKSRSGDNSNREAETPLGNEETERCNCNLMGGGIVKIFKVFNSLASLD